MPAPVVIALVTVPVIAKFVNVVADEPLIDLVVPEKVYIPLPEVNVPLLVKLLKQATGGLPPEVHVPAKVTSPVRVTVFVPVPVKAKVPVIVDVPVTPRVKLPVVNVQPDPIFKFPDIAKLAAVVAEAVPVIVKLP